MKFIKKHPKFVAIVAALVALLAIVAVVERKKTLSNTTEMKLANNERMDTVFTDSYYSDQLNDKEKAVYDEIVERLTNKEGGVIEFKEPLTGREYTRITSAIENEGGNYFYGFCEIPMTKDNVYVKYDGDSLLDVKDATIAKAIIFISSAEGINTVGTYEEDGTVSNLDEVADGLTRNDPDKLAQIEADQAQIEQTIDEIIAGIPKDAGEKDTLNYFMDWMSKNLEFNDSLGVDALSFTSMEEVFEEAYKSNNISCVLQGKATMLGYTKLLSYLCNQAGMESHIVLGTWGYAKQEGYTMTVVKINGEDIYVDASGAKASKLANNRYLNEDEATRHINLVDYFNYSSKE